MRKPHEYLTAALAKLRSGALSDFTETLRMGEHFATVTRIGTDRDGDEEVTEGGVQERRRVLAYRADLPAIKAGDAVELGDSLRVVTSCSSGPALALLTVGLSAAFERVPATYSGRRREGGSARELKHPICVLLLANGSADTHTGTFAPSYAEGYLVAIRAGDWPEASSEPEPSDTITVAPSGVPLTLKVSTAERHDGWYILNCRTRG